ncbi:MAG: hypothetical protein Q8R78_01240, partial [Candidatus Omnitrophota bacterium]|nr:hypothetical protein [Candidatus Omnitrophota bacterium]
MIHRFVSCITAFLLFLNSFAPAAFALPHVDTDSLRAISTQGTDAERRLTDDSSWETPPRDPAPGSVPGVFAGVFASNAGPLTSYQVAQRLGLARKTVVPDLKMLAQVGVLMTSEGQAGTTYTVIPEAVADPTVVRKLQEVLEQNFPYADVQRESNPERAEADIERILATERVKQTIASNPAVTQAVLQYARGGFGNTEAANREGLARSLERARIPADPDQVGLYARQAMDVLASQHRGVAQGGEMPWTSPPARGSVPGVLEAFHRGLASRLTKQQVADALGLSPRTIEPDLYELTQLGVLVKEGVGDDATYRLAYALREADLFTRTLVDKSLRKFYPRPGMAAAERAAVREQARAEIAQLLPTRVAINGAGRIGVNLIRAWLQQKPRKIDIVAINDIAFNFERFGSRGLEDYVTLLQREFAAAPRSQVGDVTFRHGQHPDGPYWLEVIRKPSQAAGAGANVSDVRRIYVYDGRDPAALPWKANDVDVVLESTGAFTNREAASMHLAAGAKKVIITAPATGELQTIAPGVNQELLTAEDIVLSCASCTTNAIAPPLKLLSDAFGIESFYMETTHAYTADQSLKDTLRPGAFLRGREAAENIIPTSTGAAKAIGDVIPELAGKGTGVALRVPVADGSIVGITAVVEKPTTKAEVNELLRKAAVGPLKGIMA